jgi:hypothetical protein
VPGFGDIDEIHRRMLILHQYEFKASKELKERIETLEAKEAQ